MLLCGNYWAHERKFCMVIQSKVLAVECFLCHFEQNVASMSLLKIAGRNRIFSPLRIEAKRIEN